MRSYLLLAVLPILSVALSCDRSVDEAPSLIAQAQEQEQGGLAGTSANLEPATSQAAVQVARATVYVKREGLHIDAPYLANRKLSSIAPEVLADQLGKQLARKELPETEEELTFEKADLWLYDGRIYRVRKKLAHPMDIPTALGTSGFPLDLGPPIESTSELRWNFTWNMRRIRLERARDDERLYVAIDVYAFLPKEFF